MNETFVTLLALAVVAAIVVLLVGPGREGPSKL
jgi:hypothetical protein